jgi:hypothetical protein
METMFTINLRKLMKNEAIVLSDAIDFMDEKDGPTKFDLENKTRDEYTEWFGNLCNIFPAEDYKKIKALRHGVAKEEEDDSLYSKLLNKYFSAIHKRNMEIFEKRMRLYEIIILAQDYKLSRNEIMDKLHMTDRYIYDMKKRYHFDFPENIKYQVRIPKDVFPKPIVDDDDDE